MTEFEKAVEYLPKALKNTLLLLPDSFTAKIQEIRLRVNAPVTFSTTNGEWLINKSGQPSKIDYNNCLICNQAHIEECFLMLCEYSIHTHQQELRNGFVTSTNGCRAGIAGTAVVENGEVTSMRNITSICLRIARKHDGCAVELMSVLMNGGKLHSALICGEPSSGKSSLLRDLAKQFSAGLFGKRFRTAVVDERGELSGEGNLVNCDVLKNCPKAVGIQQAVRCLAPDVVIFDELGSLSETRAVIDGLNSGVAAIASAHCSDIKTLLRRPPLTAALESGAFELFVFLEGRRSPGALSRIMKAGDIFAEINRSDTNYIGGNGNWHGFFSSIKPTRGIV